MTDLEVTLQWYEVRSCLVGDAGFMECGPDVPRGLRLAASCSHPEAVRLTAIFAGKAVQTREEALSVFLEQGDNDVLCQAFAALLSSPFDEARIRRSAQLGCSFAQTQMASLKHGEVEGFHFASLGALQGERECFNLLGACYRFGRGCPKDLVKAKENYTRAAELNDLASELHLGALLDESDLERWHWLGRAARQGSSQAFLTSFTRPVNQLRRDASRAPAVFAIGRALKGQLNMQQKKIFGNYEEDFAVLAPIANRAIEFFCFQCAAARRAVDSWCLIARRFNVNRDLRKLIGLLIWEMRRLGEYKTQEHSTEKGEKDVPRTQEGICSLN